MFSLATNLAIIFGTQIVVGNIVKYFLPFIAYIDTKRKFAKLHAGKIISAAEREYMLNIYDPLATSIRNYTTVAIQFGYM